LLLFAFAAQRDDNDNMGRVNKNKKSLRHAVKTDQYKPMNKAAWTVRAVGGYTGIIDDTVPYFTGMLQRARQDGSTRNAIQTAAVDMIGSVTALANDRRANSMTQAILDQLIPLGVASIGPVLSDIAGRNAMKLVEEAISQG